MTEDKPPAETPSAAFGTPEGRRIITLLWDPPTAPPGRGPRPKLTLDQVVAAGIALADVEGLEQLSMRKVAAALDVGAMSLYTYVPGRSELIELMIDAVYAELDHPFTALAWRPRLEHLIRDTWDLYRRHPWLLDYNQIRMPLGPHILDADEQVYAALRAAGFEGHDNLSVKNFIGWQLLGAARSVIGDEAEARRTGVSYEAYWESRSSFWATYFDPTRYPSMLALWQSGAFDEKASLDQLVERLLDAVERARP